MKKGGHPRCSNTWITLCSSVQEKGLDMNYLLMYMRFFSDAGQVVSSEIMMASEGGCPIEMQKIEIEICDRMYDSSCEGGRFMPFHRAGYKAETGQSPNNPREQVTSSLSSRTFRCKEITQSRFCNNCRTFCPAKTKYPISICVW